MSVYIEIVRPFTLVPPLLGVLSGSAMAYIANLHLVSDFSGFNILVGCLSSSCLNAASNVLNRTCSHPSGLSHSHTFLSDPYRRFLCVWSLIRLSIPEITDIDIDKVNKPDRPLPSDRMSMMGPHATSSPSWLVASLISLFTHIRTRL